MQGALFVTAGVVAVLLYVLSKRSKIRQEEDRPQIVVRNARLKFETGKDWTLEAGGGRDRWKPDHSLGRSVQEFVVCPCGLTGSSVEITFTDTDGDHTFAIGRENIIGKYEPVLTPFDTLEHESASDKKKLKMKTNGNGRITKVIVDGSECAVPNSGPVTLTLTMIYR